MALLDEVEKGATITVTKRGRAVAIVQPVNKTTWKSSAGMWAGKVEIIGDLDDVDNSHLWNAVRKRKAK
jgi:prevent-host-death family protein